MKLFHALFFSIALLLIFFSSASPESDANFNHHNSFRVTENVGQNKELGAIEVSHKENTQIQKLTNGVQEKPVDEMKETETIGLLNSLPRLFNGFWHFITTAMTSRSITASQLTNATIIDEGMRDEGMIEIDEGMIEIDEGMIETDGAVTDLPSGYFLLKNKTPYKFRGSVGVPLFLVLEGKKQFENGTINEYKWAVDYKKSSNDNLRISRIKDYMHSSINEIPDLFYLNVVAIETGEHQLTLQNIRSRDNHVKDRRIVNINSRISDRVFINKRRERTIDGKVDYIITFVMEIESDDYTWTIDTSVTTPSLRTWAIVDDHKYESVPYHEKKLKTFNVVPTTEGTSLLKLVCRRSCGTIIQTSTVTIKVK